MNKIICFIGLALIFGSCKKDDNSDAKGLSDYLVFGSFHGFCQGEQCIELFRIDSLNLFEDQTDGYPNQKEFYKGDYVALSEAKFKATKSIQNDFPEKLLEEVDTVFGCPDCLDQGGYYVEYKKGEVHRFWIIDKAKGSVPTYLHPFMEEMQEKIEALK